MDKIGFLRKYKGGLVKSTSYDRRNKGETIDGFAGPARIFIPVGERAAAHRCFVLSEKFAPVESRPGERMSGILWKLASFFAVRNLAAMCPVRQHKLGSYENRRAILWNQLLNKGEVKGQIIRKA
jgi:hypothetical protein